MVSEFEMIFPSLKGKVEFMTIDGTDVKWRVVGTYHIVNHCIDNQRVKEFIEKIAPKCNLDYIGDESKISITKKKFVEFVKELGLK